ncbi:hypothetical protein TNIN_494681 [Trichonephila inaurata madagascariensis]|uniref:Uncharacterized protein n=1 Tax=Trichonephila inaurata madagascariensis TaxID=2747483 RepID=A0A8X6XPQ6_9ARAC|nr:hypothetical protein TNIN_494681 [Trichonephila inaurata madagascariensis]
MTEAGDLNLSKEPKEIDTEICVENSHDEILSKAKETVVEIYEAQDGNDKVSGTPTSYNDDLNRALDLSTEKIRQITLDESNLKTESNLDNLPENSLNMTETFSVSVQVSDCNQLGSSNMDETVKDCDELGTSNMDETVKDCDQLGSLNMDETVKDCDQLGSSNVNEIEKDCDQSRGKSELNEEIQSSRSKNDVENISNLNKSEEKVDSKDGTVQDMDKKVKALKSSNLPQCPTSPSLRKIRKAGQTPTAKSIPSRALTSPPMTRSRSRELRLQQTPENFGGRKGNKDDSNEEGKITRGRVRQRKEL